MVGGYLQIRLEGCAGGGSDTLGKVKDGSLLLSTPLWILRSQPGQMSQEPKGLPPGDMLVWSAWLSQVRAPCPLPDQELQNGPNPSAPIGLTPFFKGTTVS